MPVLPPTAASTMPSSVVGTWTTRTPRSQVAATKPARSVIAPPPTPTTASVRVKPAWPSTAQQEGRDLGGLGRLGVGHLRDVASKPWPQGRRGRPRRGRAARAGGRPRPARRRRRAGPAARRAGRPDDDVVGRRRRRRDRVGSVTVTRVLLQLGQRPRGDLLGVRPAVATVHARPPRRAGGASSISRIHAARGLHREQRAVRLKPTRSAASAMRRRGRRRCARPEPLGVVVEDGAAPERRAPRRARRARVATSARSSARK